jgi:hypothetical protein
LACAVALAAFLAPAARADEPNKLTYLTFSGPVELPGVTLPAGTYMFRLADVSTSRHIVQVFDKDGSKLFATLMTIPNQRLEPTGQNVVLFAERPSGTPQAVKAWWYPGNTIGEEFVYPKSEAIKIAQATHQPVLATPDKNASTRERMKTAEVGRVTESGAMTPERESATAVTPPAGTSAAQPPATPEPKAPTTAPAEPAAPQAAGTSGQTRAQKPASAARGHRNLPATASTLPLIELLAVLSLAGAFGARRLRKHLAVRR